MASFFEPLPPPPEPPPPRPRPPRWARSPQWPWFSAPDAVIGKTVALNLVLGRSEKAVLWIPGLTVYPEGFEFHLEVRHRLDELFEHPDPLFAGYGPRRRRRASEEGFDSDLLRFGIQFSDGRKATTIDSGIAFPMAGEPVQPPEGPVLSTSGGGGGGGGRWDQGFWVWPLPPAGLLAFVCEWRAADIPEARHEIDSALVRDAASDAVILVSDSESQGDSGS